MARPRDEKTTDDVGKKDDSVNNNDNGFQSKSLTLAEYKKMYRFKKQDRRVGQFGVKPVT